MPYNKILKLKNILDLNTKDKIVNIFYNKKLLFHPKVNYFKLIFILLF